MAAESINTPHRKPRRTAAPVRRGGAQRSFCPCGASMPLFGVGVSMVGAGGRRPNFDPSLGGGAGRQQVISPARRNLLPTHEAEEEDSGAEDGERGRFGNRRKA